MDLDFISDSHSWFSPGILKLSQTFIASVSIIVVSELGDKTFFIAAIMAMKHSKLPVFLGAMAANCLMNLIAVSLAMVTSFIPQFVTHALSIVLFSFFGAKMIFDAYQMSPNETEDEFNEAREVLIRRKSISADNVPFAKRFRKKILHYVSFVFLETFTMTFVGEWGDKSQISTILLAAKENAMVVICGSTIGYALCTIIAVLGGSVIASVISARVVTLVGGVLFLTFAFLSFFLE